MNESVAFLGTKTHCCIICYIALDPMVTPGPCLGFMSKALPCP